MEHQALKFYVNPRTRNYLDDSFWRQTDAITDSIINQFASRYHESLAGWQTLQVIFIPSHISGQRNKIGPVCLDVSALIVEVEPLAVLTQNLLQNYI